MQNAEFIEKVNTIVPFIIHIYDLKAQKYVYVNNDIDNIIRLSKQEILESNQEVFLNFIHDEDKNLFFYSPEKIKLLEERNMIEYEFRLQLNNKTSWMQSREIVFARNENGEVLQILGTTRDINRKKAEEKILQEERAFSESVIKASPSVIYIQDLETGSVVYSSVQKHIEGYISSEELQNMKMADIEDIIHPDDLNITLDNLNKLKNSVNNEVFEYEVRIKYKTNQYRWTHIRNTVFKRDSSGKPLQVLGNTIDINDKRNAEKELLEAVEELKSVNEELDSFVYKASHDLRSPLGSILGLVNIIKSTTPDNETQPYIDLMEKSIHKVIKVTDDLIDYTRTTKANLHIEEINICSAVEAAITELRFMKNGEFIEFKTEHVGSQTIHSDKIRLNMILNNLIGNAIKYHRIAENNPLIKIDINNTEKYLLLKFQDNGLGIDKEYQPKLFNMFYRASKDSTGSGLGLYIVKSAIEKLNGKIELTSELGIGTEFVVTLPHVDVDK